MLLDDLDLSLTPYPLAIALSNYRRARRRDMPEKALQAALRFMEESVRLASLSLLSDRIGRWGPMSPQLASVMAGKRSFGQSVDLLFGLAEVLADDPAAQALRDRKGAKQESFSRVVHLRNRLAHGGLEGRSEHERLLRQLSEQADALQWISTWLEGLELLSVYSPLDQTTGQATALSWAGPTAGALEVRLSVAAFDSPQVLRSGTVLTRRDGQDYSVLSPLLLARDDPTQDGPELYVLETIRPRGGRVTTTWHNYVNPDRSNPGGADEEFASYGTFLQHFTPPPAPRDPSRDLDRFLFATTPILINRLLDRYVERPEVPAALAKEIQTRRAGNFWVVAGAGAGKSSIMSAIVRQYEAVHHFVSASEGRNHQPAILRSLIAQLIRRVQSDDVPSADDQELPHQLGNLLAHAALRPGPEGVTVLVLDGLDELGDAAAIEHFLSIWPQELPDGVFLVVASRPLPPGMQPPQEATVYELRPLSVGDLRMLAEKHDLPRSPKACERAFVASGGNPLLAVWALAILRDDPGADLTTIGGLDALLGPLLEKALNLDSAANITRFLALLVAAREPLDMATISMACSISRIQTADMLARLRDLLSVTRQGVSLSHVAVAEYLLNPRSLYGIEQAEVTSAHRDLAALIAAGRSSLGPAAHAWHALLSGDASALNSALTLAPVRQVLPSVVVTACALDSHSVARALSQCAQSGEPSTLALVSLCLENLALSGQWQICRGILSQPWSVQLEPQSRLGLELAIARAADELSRFQGLAQQLLSIPGLESLDPQLAGKAHLLRAEEARLHGHHRQAREDYLAARQLSADDSALHQSASFQLADLDYVEGRLSESERLLEELAKAATASGDFALAARVARERGHLQLSRGLPAEAADLYTRCLDQALVIGRRRIVTQAYVSLAEAAIYSRLQDPYALLELANEHGLAAGIQIELAKALYVRAEAFLVDRSFEESIAQARVALGRLTEVGYESGKAHAHLVIARAALASGDPETGLRHSRRSFEYYAREQIYPHLYRASARTMVASRDALGTGEPPGPTLDEFESRIPHLDQIIVDLYADQEFSSTE